jgi:spermidine synthase
MTRARLVVLAIAFVSGVAALIYQVVWLRWFRLLFGNTAYAASATLCAFFLGLALGAALFGRLSASVARPLRLYAWLEIGGVGLALLVPIVVGLYDPLYVLLYERMADSRATFVAVKFALALVAMLPPAVLLGGALPPLAAAFVADPGRLGRDGGLLYAVNTLGAAGGAALAGLWLPEHLGVRATYGVAIALALSAAAAAFASSARLPALRIARGEVRAAPRALLLVAFVSGLGTLALEVLLIRALGQITSSSVYSYGAVLLVVLLCLAAGAAAAAASEGRIAARPLLAGALALETLLLLALPGTTVWATNDLHFWASGSLRNGLALAAALGGPALLVGALILPLTFRLAAGGAVGPRVGGLIAANTLGGVLGSLGASFVLLEQLGLWTSFAAVGALYAASAVAAVPSVRGRGALVAALGVAAGAVLVSPAHPGRLPVVALREGERVVAVAEGAHGVVSVLESSGIRQLKIDNHYSLAGSGAAKTEERSGHLALLLHPDPRRVAFVGAATGGTAASAVVHGVESIELVEIVPEVQAFAAEHFAEDNRGVHRDSRARLVVEDGRNHLRATPGRYDVVVTDLFVPWRAGVGAMYSREHFEAVRGHLTPRGVFCQWLALYQLREEDLARIVSTFLAVFPEATVWRGDFFASRPRLALVGINGPPPSVGAVDVRLSELAARGVTDRWVTDPRAFWMLYIGPAARLAAAMQSQVPNTDDWPHFEFAAARSSPAARQVFRQQIWERLAEATRTPAPGPDTVFPNTPGPGAEAGNAFARATLLATRQRGPRVSAARRHVRRLVPPDLLEAPDPSVAEVWP